MDRTYKILLAVFLLLTTNYVFADLPYTPIQFPRDEGAHYANVPYSVGIMDEWWYYVGKITATDGHNFGYWVSYVSFTANLRGITIQIPMLQLQITDIDNQKVYNTTALFPASQTTLSTKTLAIQYGNAASLTINTDGSYQLNGKIKSDQGNMLDYNLKLSKTRQSLLVGNNGLVEMWNHTNSYYYSNAFLKPEGYIKIDDQTYTVNTNQSRMWMDHQWGDFLISPLTQWYWNGIQLDNGIAINFSTVLNAEKDAPPRISATIQMPNGAKLITKNILFKAIPPVSGYVQAEEISFPDMNLQLTLQSFNPGQHMHNISESTGAVTGLYNGKPISGIVQMETTVVK